ncbi:MAG: hypothetical protein GY909_18540 [Oligoflexia bacterium]|nr:hypothetical protein [Oligoflexia bacterium]
MKYFIDLFIMLAGTFSTFFIQQLTLLTPVFASSLATITFYLLIPRKYRSRHIEALFFCATFLGMTTRINSQEFYLLLIPIIISLSVYHLLKKQFNGLGGKLGTIAFIGCLSLLIIGRSF